MRYRSSRTLVFHNDGETFVACNFLTRSVFECSADLIGFLGAITDWSDRAAIRAGLADYDDGELDDTLEALVENSAIVLEGSALALREEAFSAQWKWGVPTALMHFCLQDPDYMSLDEAIDLQRTTLAKDGGIDLHLPNGDGPHVVKLPEALAGNSLLQLMARRRTRRNCTDRPVPLAMLSDCLFAGMGITGSASNAVLTLPLSMTPSGGARNPYEAYVFARNVENLQPGIYHYSAFEHTLARLPGECPPLSLLVGGQEWADTMPCLVMLVARMDRTMWKYSDPNAYRVVMIEAGHIGQNIMLAATLHGMTACPTAALSHSTVNEQLGIDNPTHTPVYALTLGWPL